MHDMTSNGPIRFLYVLQLYSTNTHTDPPLYNVAPSFVVNEGETFNLSTLNLDANPTPGGANFSWTFNGQPLMGQPGVIELGVNSILLRSVLRNQSGVYMITSSNRAGSGQASFALNVNCKCMHDSCLLNHLY